MSWNKIKGFVGGHRFFTKNEEERVYIADGSGSTPDTTDDGVMWVNPEGAIEVGVGGNLQCSFTHAASSKEQGVALRPLGLSSGIVQ